MLSHKLIAHCKTKGWWFDAPIEDYRQPLLDLGVAPDSDFMRFFLHVEDCPTFRSQNVEMFQVGWFLTYSSYEDTIRATHEMGLPEQYLPLDDFQSERGFFYNRSTGEVLELEAGPLLEQFLAGEVTPQWPDFNAFLEWYFELS
ncbi:hypothetical protein ACIPZF_16440 [Pseudomonas sp. NPDC089752]|uniref:hypothetical protein n=1 Tax=Pseudomonas sp. NPDC089752 TaxID=3364472 RepID=UPI003821B41A